MVSQKWGGGARGRLLAAAAAEFAARGFDGATVDRIAARAGANKALVYYYFGNKARLYREILRDLFAAVAAAVDAVRAAGGPADRQIVAFIRAIAREAGARPHFPAIWLREMADAGRHLDAAIVVELRRIVLALSAILEAGRGDGRFRRADPFLTHLGIVAPLMLFLASAPMRQRFHGRVPPPVTSRSAEDVIDHIQTSVLAALAAPPVSSRRSRR
jgi:AcrR family transcriptional regulator